ncbi:MAG: hypothetical protein N838_23875 [Thiohalocapsa sp. PB-PSB1]|nr:MAG: hypothetical protein N838_23875 [Thiohalocapsa sp. PB-PSB1]
MPRLARQREESKMAAKWLSFFIFFHFALFHFLREESKMAVLFHLSFFICGPFSFGPFSFFHFFIFSAWSFFSLG